MCSDYHNNMRFFILSYLIGKFDCMFNNNSIYKFTKFVSGLPTFAPSTRYNPKCVSNEAKLFWF